MMKKAQAAMEFLMTYGWAILVVIIAIAALAYFGVLNPSKFLPSSCTIAPGFSCENFKAVAEDAGTSTPLNSLQLIMRNGAGQSFTAVSVAVGTCTASLEADGDDAWNDGAILGGTDGITLTACTTGNVGSRYKADITVSYTDEGNIAHSKSGQLVTEAED